MTISSHHSDPHDKKLVVLSLSGSGSYILQHMGTLAALHDNGIVNLDVDKTEVVAYQALSGGSMVAAMANAGLLCGFSNRVKDRIRKSSFSEKYKKHLMEGFERTKESSLSRVKFLANELGEWEDSELSWKLSKNWLSQIWGVWRHGGKFDLKSAWTKIWELMPKTYCSPEWASPMVVYGWKQNNQSPVLWANKKGIIHKTSPYKYHVVMDEDTPTWLPIVASCSVPIACRPVRHKFKGSSYIFHDPPPKDHEDNVFDGALLDNNPDQYLLGAKGYAHLTAKDTCGCILSVESVDIISDNSTQGYYMGNYTPTPPDSWWRWLFLINLYQIIKGSLLGLLRSKRIEHIADTLARQINESDDHIFMILNNKVDVSKKFKEFEKIKIPDSTQFTGWTKMQAMAAITQGYESTLEALKEQKTMDNMLKHTGRSI